ncbi:LysR family transcriptional regulator [Streptomyces sp. NBC_01233]|uniref:LysR family transcriptional regulator n=1 Tax=Streptomyces sp. NBC_01233 TaxID=2903787 RepID=UPI002E0DF876|nr:LysR substrate-binding domain-containing protein [Streptomyces sp. NBC_01233]
MRLHLARPPLSRRIREREADPGCRLFDRVPTGARLTPAGEVVLAEARDLLERAERTRERVSAAEAGRVLVPGVVAGAGLEAGPPTLAALRRACPGVRVRLREAPVPEPSAGLREDRVDLALTRLPFDTAGLTVCLLGEEPVAAAFPPRIRWRPGPGCGSRRGHGVTGGRVPRPPGRLRDPQPAPRAGLRGGPGPLDPFLTT